MANNSYRAARRMITVVAALLVTLFSAEAQDTVRYVTSIDELRRATIDGTRVIVITSHLDLASAQTASGPGELLKLANSTEAILGMCSTPPPPGIIELHAPLTPGACLITVLDHFISVPAGSPATSRWLDKLYIKVDAPKSIFPEPSLGYEAPSLVQHESGVLYMTNVTLDGHNHYLRAIEMNGDEGTASLYTEDCMITAFRSDQAAAVAMGGTSSAAFHHTSMVNNWIEVGPPKNDSLDPTSTATGNTHPMGSAILAGPNATLLMHDCNLEDNLVTSSESAFAASPAGSEPALDQFLEDTPSDVYEVSVVDSTKVWASPVRQVYQRHASGEGSSIRDSMPWTEKDGFTVSQEDFDHFSTEMRSMVHARLPVAMIESVPPANGGGNTIEDRKVVVILAALFAGIMLAALIATATALHWWRKSKVSSHDGKQSESSGSFRNSLVPWSRGGSTEKEGAGHSSNKSESARVSDTTLANHSWNTPRNSAVRGNSHAYGNSQISLGGGSGARNSSSDVATPTITAMHAHAAHPTLVASNSVSSTQSAPANSLQASRAVQKPVSVFNAPPVPHFNDSTGAFGTERTDTSSVAAPAGTYVTRDNVYDSSTVSLTTSGDDAVEKEKKVLEETLDSMAAAGTPYLLQYVMKGPVKWRLGSRGAVQFARSRLTGEEVAIKFFIDRNAYRCEEAAMAQPQLRKVMPSVVMMDAALKKPAGSQPSVSDALPPCVVHERAQPLDEWCDRARPGAVAVLRMLCAVAQQVVDMHAAGFAHRDIKPANILWVPLSCQWTLSDFGCAAPVGYVTDLTDCAVYVPPETLVNLDSKPPRGTVTVEPSVDVWALGVVALETLSGTVSAAAFAPVDTPMHTCTTKATNRLSATSGSMHVQGERSKTVSVCDAMHDDHATHVTQQLFAQLSNLNLSRHLARDPDASLARVLSTLRLRIAACIARDPQQRPPATHVLHALQQARDALQAVTACTEQEPSEHGSIQATRMASKDSLLSDSSAPQPSGRFRRQPQQGFQPVSTGGKTPTYTPASPELTCTQEGRQESTTKPTVFRSNAASLSPEVLAAKLRAHSTVHDVHGPHAHMKCTPEGAGKADFEAHRPNHTHHSTPPLEFPNSMLPLEVTTDGSGAEDSPDSVQHRPTNFASQKVNSYMTVSSSASDSSCRSLTGLSTISGTQPKIRSKKPLLQTVTSGIPSMVSSPTRQPYFASGAQALVSRASRGGRDPPPFTASSASATALGGAAGSAVPPAPSPSMASAWLKASTSPRESSGSSKDSPPALTASRALRDASGSYMHAPHAHSNSSETSITPDLTPRTPTLVQQAAARQNPRDSVRRAAPPLFSDVPQTPPGRHTPENPSSPCGHPQSLQSIQYRASDDDSGVTPPSSFEAIEGGGGTVGVSDCEVPTPTENFLTVPSTLTASRRRLDAEDDAQYTTLSGGVLRPSAFRTVTNTETSVAADETTQFTGITMNMHGCEPTEASSVQLEASNLTDLFASNLLCNETPSLGRQHDVRQIASQQSKLAIRSKASSVTNQLMADG